MTLLLLLLGFQLVTAVIYGFAYWMINEAEDGWRIWARAVVWEFHLLGVILFARGR